MLDLSYIKKDFNDVIKYSQNLEEYDFNCDHLIDKWYTAKEEFIKAFGNKCIYEYPITLNFKLSVAEKEKRFKQFVEGLRCIWKQEELADYVLLQEEGFFENKTVKKYKTNDGKIIPEGAKLVKSFKFFLPKGKALREIQDSASSYIQEDYVRGILCLSVHPLDFLSLSENGHNWRTCHSLDGDYRAGNISYLLDDVTFIAYLKAQDNYYLPNFPTSIPWNSKKWRVLLHLSKDKNLLMAGKQYPLQLERGMQAVLNRIKNDINLLDLKEGEEWSEWESVESSPYGNSESMLTLGIANSFNSFKFFKLSGFVTDAENSRQYNDILNSGSYIPLYSFRYKKKEKIPLASVANSSIRIGEETKCIMCQEKPTMQHEGTMLCLECECKYGTSEDDTFTYCDGCGRRMFTDDTIYVEGSVFCNECFDNYCFICADCEEYHFNENLIYDEESDLYLCQECYQDRRE